MKFRLMIMAPLFAIFLNSPLHAALIDYTFSFSSTFGAQPTGSFTYDNTVDAERFTAFFIDVNPQELNDSYLSLGPDLSRLLFETLDGSSVYSSFVNYRLFYGENLWFVDGRYEFSIPDRNILTHAGTFTITPIPIPPALWLFGTGLVGLIGIARRRMS